MGPNSKDVLQYAASLFIFRHVFMVLINFLTNCRVYSQSDITAEQVTSQSVFLTRYLSLENSVEIWTLSRCRTGKRMFCTMR